MYCAMYFHVDSAPLLIICLISIVLEVFPAPNHVRNNVGSLSAKSIPEPPPVIDPNMFIVPYVLLSGSIKLLHALPKVIE